MPLFLVAPLSPAKTDPPPGIYILILHLDASLTHLLIQHWRYLLPNTFVKIVKNNEESGIKLDYVFGFIPTMYFHCLCGSFSGPKE